MHRAKTTASRRSPVDSLELANIDVETSGISAVRDRIMEVAKCLCTVRLSRRLFPDYRRYNLDNIIPRFDLDCANRHRAIDDARVLWEFLRILRTRTDAEKLN